MKKIILISCLILAITASVASAAFKITQKEVDVENRRLTIAGETEQAGAVVSVNIPVPEVTSENLEEAEKPGDYIFYSNELICDESGDFSAQIDFPEGAKEGKYIIYMGGKAAGEVQSTAIWFAEKATFDEEIAKLNELAENDSYSDFKNELEENGWKAGLASEAQTLNNDILVSILFDYAKNTGLGQDSAKNSSVYNSAAVAQLLSEGNVNEAEKMMTGMYLSDSDILADYNTYVTEENEKEYFAENFAECSDLEGFEKSFLDAFILTIVKYSDGTNNIKTVFTKYNNYLGVNLSNAGPDDYSYIMGKDFSGVGSLVTSFNQQVQSSSAPTGGTSGGGGGSSGGGSNNMGAILNSGISIVNPTTPEEINIKFEDLNPVPWAYTAISNLFSKGIIHGKSETQFSPNEPVKREEFVKMLVEMAGIEVLNYKNEFSDVDENAWYANYVNTAYNNGVCNGIGDGNFGVGNNISREDMCVMTYNVLKKITQIADGENVFEDESEFNDYSKAPVKALNAVGIVNGVGENKFNPKGNATRAEAAVIIYNTLSHIDSRGVVMK